MLPHNALQYLLLSSLQIPLIATSGNISNRPLCITEEEAFSELSNVADAFLIHNRRITHRLDDSVVQIISDRPMLIRRARGYIPYAISIPEQLNPSSSCILAAGGHLKNGFAIAKKSKIYVSQYIGDLDSCENCQSYNKEVTSWEKLLSITPSSGVGDTHPEYYTSHYLQTRALKTNTIQHHKAHIWSGMLDNQIKAPLLGFSWDGTGYGDDETIWGGESFIVDEKGMKRFSSLYPFMLPGSEKAIHEPRRSALGILYAMFKANIPSLYKPWLESSFNNEELSILLKTLEKEINAPICSSMGRFFDAISALLDCSLFNHFEGEAAMALEAIAERCEPRYNLPLLKQKDLWIIDWRPMVHQIFEDKIQSVPLKEIAFSFHHALAESIVAIAHTASIEKVLLTGGVMQNKLLADMAIHRLQQEGFKPFWHQNIPPNDGGLAVGQLLGNLLCV
jgi:hydrogenase maturation protein HypF